jgi:hypothetical protein
MSLDSSMSGDKVDGAVAPAVRGEHERGDGGRHPDGLSATQIPIASRIVSGSSLSKTKACAELVHGSGSQLDRAVVVALREGLGHENTRPTPRALA